MVRVTTPRIVVGRLVSETGTHARRSLVYLGEHSFYSEIADIQEEPWRNLSIHNPWPLHNQLREIEGSGLCFFGLRSADAPNGHSPVILTEVTALGTVSLASLQALCEHAIGLYTQLADTVGTSVVSDSTPPQVIPADVPSTGAVSSCLIDRDAGYHGVGPAVGLIEDDVVVRLAYLGSSQIKEAVMLDLSPPGLAVGEDGTLDAPMHSPLRDRVALLGLLDRHLLTRGILRVGYCSSWVFAYRGVPADRGRIERIASRA